LFVLYIFILIIEYNKTEWPNYTKCNLSGSSDGPIIAMRT